MNSASAQPVELPIESAAPTDWSSPDMKARINRRYRAERRFRLTGLISLILAGAFLLYLLSDIASKGWSGFFTTHIALDVPFDATRMGIPGMTATAESAERIARAADFGMLPAASLSALTGTTDDRRILSDARGLLSQVATSEIRNHFIANPAVLGQTARVWVTASSPIDQWAKGKVDMTLPEAERPVSDRQSAWLDALEQGGKIRTVFNKRFFLGADSTSAELAAVWGATKGSLLTLAVTLLMCFPIGVMTAVYLEEFAPKNRFTDFIEVNINNLAAVPSIIFGLLGLSIFLGWFGLPRSAPLVGGMTLALMTLPVIVIAGRVSIKAVPPSIRDAAMGVGASPLQVVMHHVLPLAIPGILTGTIIGMARALGETAPLLMVGMRAFVVDVPDSLTESATVLPVQIFLWSDEVARGFVEKTSAAIIVLLAVLLSMNALAIYLRNRFEQQW